MNKKPSIKKPLAAALGATFLASAALPSMAAQTPNPFVANDLPSEYELVGRMGRDGKEANCGEGNCGEDGKHEGSCGEGRCGEGEKGAEGKCGEGKCGGEGKRGAEASCGEGRCGGR